MTVAAKLEETVEQIEPVAKAGMTASEAIHYAILAGGEPARRVADFLHGTWLGHPLHPVMTDITIGAWAMGSVFDAAGAVTQSHELKRAADQLVLAGTISAVPTAVTGMVDYSTFPEKSSAPATLHAVLNLVNFGLYIGSVQARRSGHRRRGVILSTIGLGLTAVSAWLGGSLVYRHRIGVDNSDDFKKSRRFAPVMDEKDLPQRTPVKVELEGNEVMVYRDGEEIYALGNRCAHAHGPLNEGKIEGSCVECPWHQSVFDMRDGRVVHGPSCHAQPAFETRVRGGKVELRLLENGKGERTTD